MRRELLCPNNSPLPSTPYQHLYSLLPPSASTFPTTSPSLPTTLSTPSKQMGKKLVHAQWKPRPHVCGMIPLTGRQRSMGGMVLARELHLENATGLHLGVRKGSRRVKLVGKDGVKG